MKNEIEVHKEEVHEQHDEHHDIEAGPIKQPVKAAGVGVFVWMLTLIGTRMGGGIVGLPYATQQLGFVTTLWIHIVFSIMATFSIWLLLKVREVTGESSFSNIGYYWYGRISIFVINAIIALAQLGYPIIFFIVFGDVSGGLIDKVNTSGISFWSSRWLTHTFLAVVMIYLVLKKEIHQLKYASFALLCLIIAFVVLYFINYLISDPHPNPPADLTYTKVGLKFFAFLPTVPTSYSIHPSFFTAFMSLKDKTNKNGTKAGTLAIITLFIFYIVTPLITFGLYGASVKTNMLKNVAGDSGVIPTIQLFLYMVIAVVHIPIIFFIGKEAVLIIFDEITRKSYSRGKANTSIANMPYVQHESIHDHHDDHEHHETHDHHEHSHDIHNHTHEHHEEGKLNFGENHEIHESERPNDKKVKAEIKQAEKSAPTTTNAKEYLNMRPLYYYLLTIISFVIVVLLSIVVGDVSIFFGLIGATAAWFNILLGPGSFYIISFHKKKVGFNGVKSVIVYIWAWIIAVIGACGMIGLNICVILNAIS